MANLLEAINLKSFKHYRWGLPINYFKQHFVKIMCMEWKLLRSNNRPDVWTGRLG
jgi:hypothetical protein